VLYEMLTGRAAFARPTISDTIAAILDRDPDWEAMHAAVPDRVRSLVKHCLAKDPRQRLRDIADARLQIDEAVSSPGTPAAAIAPVSASRTSVWKWATAILGMTAIAAAGLALLFYRTASVERPARFTLSLADQDGDLTLNTVPLPSPDGRYFVFVGTKEKGGSSLWIRPVDSGVARSLAGTEGAQTPIWSPDGRWIGFFADEKLKKVGVDGGQPQTIAAVPGFQDAAWGKGEIIFRASNRQPLSRISESGGEPSPLTQLNAELGENSHRGPSFLPDGRRFLFTSRCTVAANNALYLGSLDAPGLVRVMSAQSKAVYLPAAGAVGALLHYRDGGLEVRPFDADRNVLGDPQPVLSSVDYNAAGVFAFFHASADGRVIVARPAGSGGTQLIWFERNGEQTGSFGGSVELLQPRISPKGDRVAFSRPDVKTGNRDVWTMELARGVAAPLTLHTANDWHPVWSADGSQMLFNSDRGGKSEGVLFVKRALDASAEETRLLDAHYSPTDWSRDGQWIAATEFRTTTTYSVVIISTADPKRSHRIDAPFRHGGARFSPDGKWVAYASDETGRFEVFVRAFAGGAGLSGQKIQISASGGDFPVWRADGKELYFMSEDATIHALPADMLRLDGPVPPPQALFRACPGAVPALTPMSGRSYANAFDTLDGKRFLVDCSLRNTQQFNVLMNWPLTARK
jgi:Tol biopolymer transport system component